MNAITVLVGALFAAPGDAFGITFVILGLIGFVYITRFSVVSKVTSTSLATEGQVPACRRG